MKPVIKIFGLPQGEATSYYDGLRREIIEAIVARKVGIIDEDGVMIFMPMDPVIHTLCENILVEIGFAEVRHGRMLDAVLSVMKEVHPKAYRQGSITFRDVHGELSQLTLVL